MASERVGGPRSAAAGFSLTELLVVIGLIAVLAALSVPAISAVRRRSQTQATRALMDRLRQGLEQYSLDFGQYPPSRPEALGLRSNRQNDGIEALTRALSTRSKSGPYVELQGDELANCDQDLMPSGVDPTDAGPDTALREVVDVWGQPLVYIHHREYDAPAVTWLPGERTVEVRARQDAESGQFQGLTTYQLWSAGPDGEPDTEDDLVLWGE